MGGAAEVTHVYPNALVISVAATGLPTGYIIVVGEDGVYTPAVKAPGMTVAVGDTVNLMYMGGTEPLAFQHGSSSTGVVGSGHTIQEETGDLAQRTYLNFVGTGVTATDAGAVLNRTDVAVHDPVTLGADADAILGLTSQQLTLDPQAANTVLAGPVAGPAADPTFRALVAADVPAMSVNITVAPAPDGAEDDFTVTGAAYQAGTLLVFVNGQLQVAGVDFNETTPAAGTFEFTAGSIPETGDLIRTCFGMVVAGGAMNDYIHIRDEKAQNTGGGASVAGAWTTRVLNTEVSDDGGHCSLAANQFTLAAGTYRISASAPAWCADPHQAILYNITTSTTMLVGTPAHCSPGSIVNIVTRSFISGQFNIAGPGTETFEIQHRVGTAYANGFGRACNFTLPGGAAGTEVYTVVELWKVA
jgi:hypothetical protein